MPSMITPRVARELNVSLMACFSAGVNNGITKVFRSLNGAQLPNAMECVRFTTTDTAEAVYAYAPSDYSIADETSGDEAPFDGAKMYESRLASGGYKQRDYIVPLTDFADDRVGLFQVVFHQAGTSTIVAPYRRIVDTMANGRNLTCFDGKSLFSQIHPQRPGETGGTAWSNDLVQAGGLTFSTFADAWTAMVSFPGEDGKPVGSRPTHLLVGPEYRGIAMDICLNDRPSGLSGGGNPWLNEVIPVIVPEFSGIYMLLDCSDEMEMPFVYSEREPLRMLPLYTNPMDPWVRQNKRLVWSLQGRYNVGVGHPRRALLSRKS